MAFNRDGKYFVTCGSEHLKYWYFNDDDEPIKKLAPGQSSGGPDIYLMENEAADLSKIDVQDFVGIACKTKYAYALSSNGKLCVFNENRKVEKWMNIKTNKAFGLSIAGHHLLCSCSDATVRVFSTEALEHIVTLPKPPALGAANYIIGKKKEKKSSKEDSKYADCIAAIMHDEKDRIVTMYSDSMFLIWDLSVKEKIRVMRAFLSHNSTIFDLEILPSSTIEITKFATCSTDKTIRFWNFYDYSKASLHQLVDRNSYCKELEKIIYVSDDYDHFKVPESDTDFDEKADLDQDQADDRMKLRTLKVSPDGKHVA